MEIMWRCAQVRTPSIFVFDNPLHIHTPDIHTPCEILANNSHRQSFRPWLSQRFPNRTSQLFAVAGCTIRWKFVAGIHIDPGDSRCCLLRTQARQTLVGQRNVVLLIYG